MKKISKISKIKRTENDLRQQENEKGKIKRHSNLNFDSMLKEEERKLEETQNKRKKSNTLEAYKFEVQRNIILQKKIAQMKNEEKEQEEK